jgi:endonuclease/exonuclease/phosphatase family metal-dependent hydrolase
MTYNIGFASGNNQINIPDKTTSLKNLSLICNTIKTYNPSILTIQEVDIHSKRSGFIDQITYIQKNCGYPYVAIAITWNRNWVPYPFKINPKYHWGKILAAQVVFSKHPIIKQEIHRFSKPKSNHFIYNWFYLNRLAQSVLIELENSKHITIFNTHLEAFDKVSRQEQSRFLSTQIKAGLTRPTILCGDLNAIYSSIHRTFRFEDEPYIDYKNDSTLSHFLKLPGLKEVCSDIRIMDKAPCFTYPSNKPNRQLDYMFYTPSYFNLLKTEILTSSQGSDHLPLISEFVYTGIL